MKLIVLCTLFFGLSSAHQYEVGRPNNLNCNCGWKNSDEDTVTYPWVVSIIRKENEIYLCAGTILTQYHVLTSATCVQNTKAAKIVVCFGSKESKCEDEEKKMIVKTISIIRGFKESKFKNNLAIILTENGMIFTKYVGPACFPHQNILITNIIDTDLMFLGWGNTEKLNRIDFKAKPLSFCTSQYDNMKEEMHICAVSHYNRNNGRDGGSAFVMLDADTRRYTVVGVLVGISWKTYNSGEPSLITNFTAFRDWAMDEVSGPKDAELCYKNK